MKLRSPWLIFAALLAFIAVLLWRLPVAWIARALPSTVSCQQPAGSLWDGSCTAVAVTLQSGKPPMLLGPTTWILHGWPLLRAQLAVEVSTTRGAAIARGSLKLGPGGRIGVEKLDATLPLDPSLPLGFPPNWTGTLTLQNVALQLKAGQLVFLSGAALAMNIVAQGPQPADFGSYRLEFPAAASGTQSAGKLADTAGPLQVNGTLLLQQDLSWQLDGRVKARDSAPEALQRQLQFLGSPDAEGSRPFSVAGKL